MNIVDLKPVLSKNELLQRHEELVRSFSDFEFVPFDDFNGAVFPALYLHLKNSELFRSEKSINGDFGYSLFNSMFIYPSHNFASLDNRLSKYDFRTDMFLKSLFRDYVDEQKHVSSSHPNCVSLKNKFNNAIKLKKDSDSQMREDIKSKLVSLGYVVSSIGHQGDLYGNHGEKIEKEISPLQALWHELKNDSSLIKKNIDNLLIPIFKESNSFPLEFITYSPSTDYDKTNFDLDFAYSDYHSILKTNDLPSPSIFLAEELVKLNDNKAIAVSSKLPSNQHYLQIDFDTDNLFEIKRTIGALDLKGGVIVNSGNSFHYFNPSKKFSQEGWSSMMDKLKTFDSIGAFWPEFQKKQGFSMLRITPSFEKLYFPEIHSLY